MDPDDMMLVVNGAIIACLIRPLGYYEEIAGKSCTLIREVPFSIQHTKP